MTGRFRILYALEDRAFESVVIPLVERIFRDLELPPPDEQTPLRSRGCRWKAMTRLLEDHAGRADLVVIGADVKSSSVRRKREVMSDKLEKIAGEWKVVYALPEPSVEGWIQADLKALKAGLEAELDEPVTLPADVGSYPTDEVGAKARLKSILHRSDVPTITGGVEFGPAVMQRVDFSSHRSLATFGAELRSWLKANHPEL